MSAALATLCDGGAGGWSRAVAVRVVVAGMLAQLAAGLAVCAWAGVL